MAGTWIFLPPSGGSSLYWADPVATVGDLPATTTTGEARLVEADNAIYWWNGVAWTQLTVAPGSIDINTDTTGTLAISRGGTNSTAALNNNRVMVSSGGAIVETAAITASRALESNASGIPVASTVTSTELAKLSGTSGALVDIGSVQTITGQKTIRNPLIEGQASNPTYAQGVLWYNTTDFTMYYYNDVSTGPVQIGKEVHIRVRNNSGGTIAAGTAVYITGGIGQLPTIGKAQANTFATSKVFGVTSESIANNANGYVTMSGRVQNIDTSAFADGDLLYLSASVAGGLTTSRPASPNYSQFIGVVSYANGSNGSIVVELGNPRVLGFGSANQILGMNAGGTEEEWKSTTGSGNVVYATSPTLTTPSFAGTTTLTTGGLVLANLTTVQRDALTPAAGMMIFNTDTNRFQGYFSGAWGDLHGWGS